MSRDVGTEAALDALQELLASLHDDRIADVSPAALTRAWRVLIANGRLPNQDGSWPWPTPGISQDAFTVADVRAAVTHLEKVRKPAPFNCYWWNVTPEQEAGLVAADAAGEGMRSAVQRLGVPITHRPAKGRSGRMCCLRCGLEGDALREVYSEPCAWTVEDAR